MRALCVSFFFSAVSEGLRCKECVLARAVLVHHRVHQSCQCVLAISSSRVRARCRGRLKNEWRIELRQCACHSRLAKPTRWSKQGPERRTRHPQLAKLRECPHAVQKRCTWHTRQAKPETWTTSALEQRKWRAKLAEHQTKITHWDRSCAHGATAHRGQITWSKGDAAQGTVVKTVGIVSHEGISTKNISMKRRTVFTY